VNIEKLYKSPFKDITDLQFSSKAAGKQLAAALKKAFPNIEDVDKLRKIVTKRKLGDIR
jgi:hypothetical protein